MKYFYPDLHHLHNPTIDFSDGLPGVEHLEVAPRVDIVLKGLLEGFFTEVVHVDLDFCEEVYDIHDRDYVDFLLNISKTLQDKQEYIPSIFREDMSKSPLAFQGGSFCDEIGTPIGKDTITSALNAAQTSIQGAKYILESGSDAFVLSRPPGHHAKKRKYGGYCFFNNAYLAASYLNKNQKKVAVVDIDYHIGDGSLEFASEDAPYFSIHADPFKNYPYLDSNFETDNLHVDLESFKKGVNADEYILHVEKILDKVKKLHVDIVIVSLGFDTLESDGYQDDYTCIKTEDFKKIGALFGNLKEKVLFVFEGGYDADGLELCSKNLISEFSCRR